MVSLPNMVVGMVCMLLFWGCQVFISQDEIKEAAKKIKKSKAELKAEYPYFSYPLWKRIFCVGLKRAMPKYFVVLTFIVNLTVAAGTILCIIYLFRPSQEFSDFIRKFWIIPLFAMGGAALLMEFYVKKHIAL